MNLIRVIPTKGDIMDDSRMLSTVPLALIWFGAAVSLAEILTGTFFAPLGFEQGLLAIAIGHVIGGVLFFAVSYASARTGQTAMQVAGRSFGRVGSAVFSGLNVVQLVGWTAIMIASGAAAAALLVPALGQVGWAVVIGALIALWVAIGMKSMSRVQSVAALLLFALTVVVSVAVFGGGVATNVVPGEGLSFGAAVELAAAMPLSWLPVVGDYTCKAKRPLAGSLLSTIAYTLGSCWMFAIGMGCALYAQSDDVAVVLEQAGLGAVGILVVVFSTVTTTFLDAQSAGQSAEAIHPLLNARVGGVIAAVVGLVLAVFAPVTSFEEFLYFIGSVFAPLATIVSVDYFAFGRDLARKPFDWANLALWVVGFVLYRFSLGFDLPCGNTLPVMAAVALLTLAVGAVRKGRARKEASNA